jgi:hypothetical protein
MNCEMLGAGENRHPAFVLHAFEYFSVHVGGRSARDRCVLLRRDLGAGLLEGA